MINRDRYIDLYAWAAKLISIGVLSGIFALPLMAQDSKQANEQVASVGSLEQLLNTAVRQDVGKSSVLNKVITLQAEQISLIDALKAIADKGDLKLSYDTELPVLRNQLTLDMERESIQNVLWKVLENTGLRFAVSANGQLILMKKNETQVFEQMQETITGTVTDAQSGETLPGVNILVKGTSTGASTDAGGSYEVTVPSLQDTLVFTYIGYQRQEVPVNGRMEIDVGLQPQAIAGEEVVVTGYMAQEVADLTGSVSVVSSDEIAKNQHSNVIKSLQGKVPGMYITTDGNPVGDVGIQIRGMTSVRSAPPLIVVDGMPTQANLRDINPNDIASIQVLKDAASASIYGSRAASGVILVETKKGKAGELQISYDGTFGVSSFPDKFDLMNTRQYGRALWQAAINDGMDPGNATDIYTYEWGYDNNGVPVLNEITPREWLNTDQTMRSADTDWFKAGTQLGLQNDHKITVSNGTDRSSSLFSLNYYENRGTQIHTG
ncbi:MAG TPA: TonB-dependent receptor plug domain-containing protein, partial [Fodinibius sp.]|nr:TonB-dependent receptor plug domain-containing protein [Fodinibius sp.]